MPFYSPLRYPGGKRRLTAFIMRLLDLNSISNVQYAEPYAGGASIALALLFGEYAATIHINDLSRPVYAFWHSVINDTEEFCNRIQSVDITIAEWRKQRAVYESRDDAALADLGFATFFLNRTNRSGIIGGGVIGGVHQNGKWSLAARFPKEELIRRIRKIGRYRDRIKVYHGDGVQFVTNVANEFGQSAFTFIDPPYIEKGQKLYLNNYGISDHRELEHQVTQLRHPWIVTYDYEGAFGHSLYVKETCLSFELSYSAQGRHKSREAMFLSSHFDLPSSWSSSATFRMSSRQSSHPIFARLEDRRDGKV